jgi:hypothetical protein
MFHLHFIIINYAWGTKKSHIKYPWPCPWTLGSCGRQLFILHQLWQDPRVEGHNQCCQCLQTVVSLLVTVLHFPSLALFLLPWRWKWHVPPKRRFVITPHSATSQKVAFLVEIHPEAVWRAPLEESEIQAMVQLRAICHPVRTWVPKQKNLHG